MNQNLYVFLHIPKTAGSTLAANFQQNFCGDEWLHVSNRINVEQGEDLVKVVETEIAQRDRTRTRCVFGHLVYWGIHNKVVSECTPRYITFLREPVDRCVSLYGYVKTQPDHVWHQPLMENQWTVGQWLQQGKPLGLRNNQTRRLLFDGTNDFQIEPLTRDHLEVAKQRLREYWFVGLTEAFEQDSFYLYGKLGFRRFHNDLIVNATRNKPTASPEDRHALAQANLLDSELYEFARQLRAQWLREHAAEFHLQQRKAHLIRTLYLSKLTRRIGRRLSRKRQR